MEVNIAESEPGLEANNAITLDDSDDEDLDSIFVQGDSITAAPALQSPIEPAVSERSEGPSAAALQAIATLKVGDPISLHCMSVNDEQPSHLGETRGKEIAGTTRTRAGGSDLGR